MNKIIELINKIINKSEKLSNFTVIVYKYNRKYRNMTKTILFALKGIFKFYMPSTKLSKGMQIRKIFQKLKIKRNSDRFIYYLDPLKILNIKNFEIENTTIDYEIGLEKSLEEMQKENENMKNGEYKENQKQLLLDTKIMKFYQTYLQQ